MITLTLKEDEARILLQYLHDTSVSVSGNGTNTGMYAKHVVKSALDNCYKRLDYALKPPCFETLAHYASCPHETSDPVGW